MAKVLVTKSHLEDIADAIREKLDSSDTYTPGEMAAGIQSIPTGSGDYFTRLTPLHVDVQGGYIATGTWTYGSTTARSDIYQVQSGKHYIIISGRNHGTRFRAAFFTTDVSLATRDVNGTYIVSDVDNPTSYNIKPADETLYAPPLDGYIVIGKTSQGIDGYDSYLFEANV